MAPVVDYRKCSWSGEDVLPSGVREVKEILDSMMNYQHRCWSFLWHYYMWEQRESLPAGDESSGESHRVVKKAVKTSKAHKVSQQDEQDTWTNYCLLPPVCNNLDWLHCKSI
jgi:hypothetical protein